jgi:hypothetical protein
MVVTAGGTCDFRTGTWHKAPTARSSFQNVLANSPDYANLVARPMVLEALLDSFAQKLAGLGGS